MSKEEFMKACLIILVSLFSIVFLSAQNRVVPNTDVPPNDYFTDVPMAAFLDSLSTAVMFKGRNIYADSAVLNIYRYAPDYVPEFPDSVYRKRMRNLNTRSPFQYVYNEDVRAFINLYALRRRAMTSRLLGVAAYYFPLFEEQLARHNLPLELKYLAVIESALNPKAISRAGAGGLWQFMYRTGKMYGLEVTSFVDDRFDPYKATVAACEHLSDLYRIYGDWNLVLAAYNAGSGNVNRAIRRANGETDYWRIRRFLPRETQNYVPIFIAASYVLTYAAEHNLYPIYPGYLFEKTDTVTIAQKLTFEQLAEALLIPVDELVALNPAFKMNVVPSCDNIKYVLKMPQNKIGEFLAHEQEIYSFKTLEQLIRDDALARNPQRTVAPANTHTVKSGETLSVIARKYGVTVANIQAWNNLRTTTIHVGQRLTVGVEIARQAVPEPPQNTVASEYIVANNDNLRTIAANFGCSVDKIRLWNNLRTLSLTPGQTLIIHMPVVERDSLGVDSTSINLHIETPLDETTGMTETDDVHHVSTEAGACLIHMNNNSDTSCFIEKSNMFSAIAHKFEGEDRQYTFEINQLEFSFLVHDVGRDFFRAYSMSSKLNQIIHV